MSLELAEASARRLQTTDETEQVLISNARTLFANYERVTADPSKMGHFAPLLKHYAKDPHPWKACMKDNFKRFGPKTPALCGVLKDVIRQRTDWRGKGPRPTDVGSPGVGIGEADRAANKAPFGSWNHTKLADGLQVGTTVHRVDSMISELSGTKGVIAKQYPYQALPPLAIGDEKDAKDGSDAYDVNWEDGTTTTGLFAHQLRPVTTLADALPEEIWAMIDDVTSQCDPCKVMMGLETAPTPSASYLERIS